MYFFMFLFFGGWEWKRSHVLQFFVFIFFLQDLKFPFGFLFPLWSGVQRVYLPSSVSFSPKSNAFHTATLMGAHLHPFLGSPLWCTDSTIFYTSGWRSFLQWFQINSWLHPHLLLLSSLLFSRTCAQNVSSSLLRFGINFFFFTYRWFEGYINVLSSS